MSDERPEAATLLPAIFEQPGRVRPEARRMVTAEFRCPRKRHLLALIVGTRWGPWAAGHAGGRGAERGAAVVELLVVFLTLLLPLVYVMVVMADVQRALLATSSAAREAGRVYVTGSDRGDAERRAGLAYREVLATYGVGPRDPGAGLRLEVGCPTGAGTGCAGGFGPGAEVRVVVTYRVPVARLPLLGAVAGPGLTVGATQHTRVDRYRGLGR